MKPKRETYRRTWLNKKSGRAFAIVSASMNPEARTYASLELGDCSRAIDLEFYAATREDAVERLAKVDRIRAALDTIEDFLLETLVCAPTIAEVKECNRKRKEEEKAAQPEVVDELDYL